MSDYKHGDWYCKPANESEAKEIVERAVASGALLREDVGDLKWDDCGAWGVIYGCTYTGGVDHASLPFHGKTQYTLAELRQKFPLPGESVEPEQWNGEGLPPVAIDVEVLHEGRWIGATTVGEFGHCMVCAPDGGGFYGFYENAIRPLRTEREKFVEAAAKIMLDADTVGNVSAYEAAKVIYDAIKSGAIKAPEEE